MKHKSGWMEEQEPSKKEFSLEPQESFKRWRYGTAQVYKSHRLPPHSKKSEKEEEEVECCCRNPAFERKGKNNYAIQFENKSFVFCVSFLLNS